jgi:hypothetical protein
MGPVSAVRQAGRLTLALLLVAVLGAAGVPAPLAVFGESVVGDTDASVAVGGSRVDAMAPSRAGRLLAEPSLVCVHGVSDGVPFGTAPNEPPYADLPEVEGRRVTMTVAAGVAGHGPAGVRAPPPARPVL